MVGSLHLYERNRKAAEQFLNEGWQATIAMPVMPNTDPWPAITTLLTAESAIRTRGEYNIADTELLDPYWQDFVRLLQVFRASKDGDADRIIILRDSMASNVYRTFIEQKLHSIIPQTNNGGE
jgi:thymidylate synthase